MSGTNRQEKFVIARFMGIFAMMACWFLLITFDTVLGRVVGVPTRPNGTFFSDHVPAILGFLIFGVFSILWTLALWRLRNMRWLWRRFFGVLALLNTVVFMGYFVDRAIAADISIALAGSVPFLVSAVYFLVVAYLFLSCRASGKGAQDSR